MSTRWRTFISFTVLIMMNNKGLPIFCLLILLMQACKPSATKAPPEAGEELLTKEIPQDFFKFYMQFLADTSYQLEHIQFPLQRRADSTLWQEEDWVLHRPYKEAAGYTQEFFNLNGLIIETIIEDRKLYKLERRYMPSGENYRLIYFTAYNAFEDSDEWRQ